MERTDNKFTSKKKGFCEKCNISSEQLEQCFDCGISVCYEYCTFGCPKIHIFLRKISSKELFSDFNSIEEYDATCDDIDLFKISLEDNCYYDVYCKDCILTHTMQK